VDDAHRRGLKVVVWTVDDGDRIVELANWGVDGIVTNQVSMARRAVDGA
jgi:glycerophosphoryl diester phosphodiesterase